jgi:putative Ca2+/H+ antiporter (TMEM165/GDT1 family)
MELGDKTQLAVIALAAESEFPLMVFVGVMLAFTLVTGLGATVGATLTKFVPLKYIQLASGIVFTLLGAALLVTVIFASA